MTRLAVYNPTVHEPVGSAKALGVVLLCGHSTQSVTASGAA